MPARIWIGAQPCYRMPQALFATRAMSPTITTRPLAVSKWIYISTGSPMHSTPTRSPWSRPMGDAVLRQGDPAPAGGSFSSMATETMEPSLGHGKPPREGRSQQSFRLYNAHDAAFTSSPTVGMSRTPSTAPSKGEWSIVSNMATFGDAFLPNNTS